MKDQKYFIESLMHALTNILDRYLGEKQNFNFVFTGFLDDPDDPEQQADGKVNTFAASNTTPEKCIEIMESAIEQCKAVIKEKGGS